MTLREKLLYHQVHPAKIGIDVTTALAAAVLLWQQHLLRAVIAFAWVRGALQGSGRIAAEP